MFSRCPIRVAVRRPAVTRVATPAVTTTAIVGRDMGVTAVIAAGDIVTPITSAIGRAATRPAAARRPAVHHAAVAALRAVTAAEPAAPEAKSTSIRRSMWCPRMQVMERVVPAVRYNNHVRYH